MPERLRISNHPYLGLLAAGLLAGACVNSRPRVGAVLLSQVSEATTSRPTHEQCEVFLLFRSRFRVR